jgi:TonB family protein
MALRCFSFSSDEGTTAILRQILSDLGVEGEFCTDAVPAVERITNQPFQLVIIDWDQQPEAGLLLNAARERKAAERPITLAIVSNDADAPKALHAGANSLLRKPITPTQAAETLATARDLLRSKQASSANPSVALSAASVVPARSVLPESTTVASFRAGEFLQSATVAPGGLFETETVPMESDESAQTAPVKELEPVASSVAEQSASAPPARAAGSRGLQWYLNNRAVAQPSSSASPSSAAAAAAAAAPAQVAPSTANGARGNPELLGYEQTSAYTPSAASAAAPPIGARRQEAAARPEPTVRQQRHEQVREAELFAHMQGEQQQHRPGQSVPSGVLPGKKAIIPALLLATVAVIAAPQAPWHTRLQGVWHGGQQRLHGWLNPQPVTPTQGPAAHESFTRPGDEYKLPLAEPIPDATTDPTQIEVVPVVDPTIKRSNPEGGNTMDPSAIPAQPSAPSADNPGQITATPVSENQATSASPDPFRPAGEHNVPGSHSTIAVIESPVVPQPETTSASAIVATSRNPQTSPQAHPISPSGTIPQSLKSQLAPATSLGGSRPVESAPAAIEPVQVPEAVERSLILDSPSPAYPPNARGQLGSVVLQVLIARDGSVQEAKFMQGSLMFARSASDAVKQWKFKPYALNGRPVSVQTQLTLKFKPGQ